MKVTVFFLIAGLVVALLWIGCGGGTDQPASSGLGDQTGDDDDTFSAGDDDDDDNDVEWGPEWGIVVHPDDFDFDPGCALDDPCDCVVGYLDLFDTMTDAVSSDAVEQAVQEILDGDVDLITDLIPFAELTDTIYNLAEVSWLEWQDKVTVTRIGHETFDAFEFDVLYFRGRTGGFVGYLFLPYSQEPFTPLVFMHGHTADAWDMIHHYDGEQLLDAGYAMLGINGRGICLTAEEDRVARRALNKGVSFEILRTYELLIGARYLKYRAVTQADVTDRIGALGHSAGSETIWFAGFATYPSALLSPLLSAEAIDTIAPFLSTFERDGRTMWGANMVPTLYPYSPNMALQQDQARPTIEEPYGYENGLGDVINFFDAHLK